MKFLSLLLISILFLQSCKDEQIVKKTPTSKIETIKVYDTYRNNSYTAVKIGTQYWFRENLKGIIYSTQVFKSNHYRYDTINRLPADYDISGIEKISSDTLAFQWPFQGDNSQVQKYGRMYTWYTAIDPRNACPSGYSVPSENEWDKLIKFMGGDSIAAFKLKDTTRAEWETPFKAQYNEYKFNALPTGYRTEFGSYIDKGKYAIFWSTTEDPFDSDFGIAYMFNAQTGMVFKQSRPKRMALPIRCVR